MKTLKITTGTRVTVKDLEDAGCAVSGRAKDILKKVKFSKEKKTLNLVCLTPKELGFSNTPTIEELFKKGQEDGYELCPAEVGPLLRLAYVDQPMNEWMCVVMKPITSSDGRPRVFSVERYSVASWLETRWTDPDYRWFLGTWFVFVSRKSLDLKPVEKIRKFLVF
jgi:hypothetical protein